MARFQYVLSIGAVFPFIPGFILRFILESSALYLVTGHVQTTWNTRSKRPIIVTPGTLFSAYIFNLPTKCTYAMRCIYYYQHCPSCFGAYCAISGWTLLYAQNYRYSIWWQISQLCLQLLINRILFKVRFKIVKVFVLNSLIRGLEL